MYFVSPARVMLMATQWAVFIGEPDKQILPIRIIHPDEPFFLFSTPLFDLLFSGNCVPYFRKTFKVNKFIQIILFRETGITTFDVFQAS